MQRLLFVFLFVFVAFEPAGTQNTRNTEAYGIAAKRPVFAGACHYCPYGAIAEVVKKAMKPYGYDVQICYTCASTIGPRQVSGKLLPQPPSARPPGVVIMGPQEPVPAAPPDFGASHTVNLRSALAGRSYDGRPDYAKEGALKNLRVFAVVHYPNYLLVAATKSSGITDLAQLKGRKAPLSVRGDGEISKKVLAYYGHTEESLRGAAAAATASGGGDFDLAIVEGLLSNAPEQAFWYNITQKQDLVFLQMPDDLIERLAKDPDYERVTAPLGMLRGLDRNLRTVVRRRYVVFGRDDAPDDFAYAVAKALDEQQDLWMWAPIPLYYDPHLAWKTNGLPLHRGAERYYREKSYMK